MDTKGVNPPTDLLEVSDQFVYNTTMYISPSLSIFLAEPILYCLACRTLRSGPVNYVALQRASRSHKNTSIIAESMNFYYPYSHPYKIQQNLISAKLYPSEDVKTREYEENIFIR
jgi:hypothetical protein